ncbi:MAG: site-specific integrase [Puniceicoccales bacterium]|jgi:site-specific recombinase XerD|nr:site-specific integrase [Puniceicoccales bacterium]
MDANSQFKNFLYNDFMRILQIERQLSPHTILSYQDSIDSFIAFLLRYTSIKNWQNVDEFTIRQYLIELLRDHKKSTVANRLSALKSLFSFLIKSKIISANPFINLKSPKKINDYLKCYPRKRSQNYSISPKCFLIKKKFQNSYFSAIHSF